MIRFGPWSTTLAAGMAFGFLVALLLCASSRNATANRLLAGVLVVISLKLAPYVLGFAGYYDAYPWLSFAPLSYGLMLGPLLFLHVVRLTDGALPPRWALHFVPGLVQFAYYAVLFAQPLSVKTWWADRVDGPWIDPAETFFELASLAIYLWLAWRRHARYQTWLDATMSNREQLRLPWLRNVLVVMMLVMPVWAAFEIVSATTGFDYYQRYPLYLGLTALLIYLGLEGWRHADLEYPSLLASLVNEQVEAPNDVRDTAATQDVATRDWSAQGQRWFEQLVRAGWWRDPQLTLARLARHLGTNTSYLSRALNEGLGQNFNTVVNDLRVDALSRMLKDPNVNDDLLALAMSVGFNSKASFNRLFKERLGVTPSQYRAQAQAARLKP